MTRTIEEIDTDLATVETEVSTLMSSTGLTDLATTVAQLRTDFDTFKGQVHTREEAVFQCSHTSWSVGGAATVNQSASFRSCIFIAPFPCQILSLSVVFEYWTLAANDTDYWQVSLEKSDNGNWPDITNKTTQNTGALANGGVTARKTWSLDSANWVAPTLTTGQILAVNWAPHGSPGVLKLPVLYTGRYAAL